MDEFEVLVVLSANCQINNFRSKKAWSLLTMQLSNLKGIKLIFNVSLTEWQA